MELKEWMEQKMIYPEVQMCQKAQDIFCSILTSPFKSDFHDRHKFLFEWLTICWKHEDDESD